MATVIGGYLESDESKGSGLKEVTVQTNNNRTYLDVTSLDKPFTQAIESNSKRQAIYVGEAEPGTAKGVAKWRIKKLTYSSDVVSDIQWASGTADFDKEWDERASYAYS